MLFRKAKTDSGDSWPVELRFVSGKSHLKVSFDDGFSGEIPFELLRVESPSAETRGHGGQAPAPPAGKRNVQVVGANPVGRYAVRIVFDDGHDSGLYTWPYLRSLALDSKARMKAYLERLTEHNLSRDQS